MLTRLQISNFALIDQMNLDLLPGFSVLTGETGAGKSIIIDAIGLALGDRADASIVRPGADRSDITAEFVLEPNHPLVDWLTSHDLNSDEFLALRRVIGNEGRSRAYINGQPVTVQLLKDAGEQLLDIQGQHAHYSLLKTDVQRELLDAYGAHEKLLDAVYKTYQSWKQANSDVERLTKTSTERDARLNVLNFQVGEFDALELRQGEIHELETEQRRLANGEELLRLTQQAMTTLDSDDENSIIASISRVVSWIQDAARLDTRLSANVTLLEEAQIALSEAAVELRHYGDSEELDPKRLAFVEDRLGIIHSLARKHRVQEDQLLELQDRLRSERDQLLNADEHLENARKVLEKTLSDYRAAAKKLSAARAKTAARLSKDIDILLQRLGMPHGHVIVEMNADEAAQPQAYGAESIMFCVTTNPGHPPAPLSRVASGGELARISLAIAVASATVSRVPTLIFDEVDTGVGGGIAEIIGQLMRNLGQSAQVFCITHSPQIAALAHQHLKVAKQVSNGQTLTHVDTLDANARQEELARMLGGVEITKQTRAHAKEMLTRGKSKKPGAAAARS